MSKVKGLPIDGSQERCRIGFHDTSCANGPLTPCQNGANQPWQRAPAGLTPDVIASLDAYIDKHLDQKITIQTLAEVVHVSPHHFARSFKVATGVSPHKYIVRHRLENAKRLLTTTDASLIQIALETGFSSQSHMTQTFGKVLGVTPANYRKTSRRR